MALSMEGGTRKLAAVMFTDIKGFSKKMSQNEVTAFELLKTHDALMRVIASKFEGKVVKSIGDSFMVDFASAVNAVKAAIDAQKRFWTFNKGKDEFDSIEVRIGIHLGDVMVTDDDMYGDGVNIASRIEAITEPTRICISADVYNQVKNKMDINVYSFGPMPLKNIPYPVEVFEILIDSIPELAKPSRTAQQALARKAVEDSAEVEAEEAHTIEAAKKRGSTPVPQVQDTASQVEALYKKAEELFNQGKINEAERTIDEIAKIDPEYHAAVERKKSEEERQKRVNEHYEHAGGYIREGKFDLAEQEVKEIFQMYPLDGGAQQLQLQIEEERYRKAEEERQQRLSQERKEREKKDRQVDDLIRHTEEHIEKGELQEAREALEKIYSLEPNFTARDRLEEKLRRAEALKEERERQQAFLQAERPREVVTPQIQERPPERDEALVQQRREEYARRKIRKMIMQTFAVVVVVVVAYFSYPRVKKALFPLSASIAVLPLSGSQDDSASDALHFIVPSLLSQDLSRVDRVTVVSPSKLIAPMADYSAIANQFQVRYVLHGSVKKTDGGFSINLQMFDNEQKTNLLSQKFDCDYLTLHRTRRTIVAAVLGQASMEASPPDIAVPSSNALAYEQYLNGLAYLRKHTIAALDEAEKALQESVTLDSSFASAYAAIASAQIARYMIEQNPDQGLLTRAFDVSRKALRLNPQEPTAFGNLAEIYFLTGSFDKVDENVQGGLAVQPANPQLYGLLSKLAIVDGNYELASTYASGAVKTIPDDPNLLVTLGLAKHFGRSYAEAVAAFKQAIALGLSDSLITARYLLNAWSGQDNFSDPIQYCQNSLRDYPQDYRLYYWICRAYQMRPSINEFKDWSARGIFVLTDYLDKNPNDALAHAYLGLFLSRQGKADDGETEMNRAVALAPKSTSILFRQANMYAIQKNARRAVASLREALNRRFDFSEILNPDLTLIKDDTAFISATTRKLDLR